MHVGGLVIAKGDGDSYVVVWLVGSSFHNLALHERQTPTLKMKSVMLLTWVNMCLIFEKIML